MNDKERDDFISIFEKRIEKVSAKTDAVFRFEELDAPPFMVNSAFYHITGLVPEEVPDDYCADPAVMTRFQEELFYEQIKSIDDDFVPYLMPWFGTGVLASGFGCEVICNPKTDPAVRADLFPVKDEKDIAAMEIPDPDKSGEMPRILDMIRYMKDNSFLPVGITDCQGPLTTANQLMGYDKLIYLMMDNPKATHELMEKVTEALILWVKRQKEVIGEANNECIGDQQVYIGRNAGVWISDDDAVLIGPDQYREFVVPYNEKVLQAFGGGVLHFCGTANHQIDNFLATKGLKAINTYSLHGLDALAELKKRIEDRLVLIACDFTPENYTKYYRQLHDTLSPKGLIIDSQCSPVTSMTEEGRYTMVERDRDATRKAVFDLISDLYRAG